MEITGSNLAGCAWVENQNIPTRPVINTSDSYDDVATATLPKTLNRCRSYDLV
jgi:hypothetical protein